MRAPRSTASLGVLVVALACGDDGGGGGSLSAGQTVGDAGTGADGGSSMGANTDTLDGSSTAMPATDSTGAPPAGDPQYPMPEPVDMAGSCPDGYFGPITFDFTGWACLPPCTGDPAMCPAPQTGDADAECATNPSSSGTPCEIGTPCEVEGELCGNIGMGMMGCLLPPSHCLLRCGDGQTCPDGMACSPSAGLCQYEP